MDDGRRWHTAPSRVAFRDCGHLVTAVNFLVARQGLKAVRESDGGTEADEGVQRLIRRRIERYPDEAKANMHHARSVKHKSQMLQLCSDPESRAIGQVGYSWNGYYCVA